MKRFFKYLALAAAAVASFSCTVAEPIVFDHELQAFETREGQILIEGIMPLASAADEEIYIVGPFNGDSLNAYKNPAYLMERSSAIPSKWGIYLNPSDFMDGKTLADGFTFISVKQGAERSALGEAVSHTLDIKAGEWANVYVDKWAKYFQKNDGPQKLPTHDGTVRVYIIDQTGWEAIALYQWGDENNLGGGWPGAAVTGTLDYEGTLYKYFEYDEAAVVGKSQNLIFNNNGGGIQLGDFALTFEAGTPDYFLLVTADGVTSLDAPQPEEKLPEHDGKVWVSILDQTEWEAITLYQWGDENNLGGSWPGLAVTGTFDYKGKTWKYFEYDESAVVGKGQNLIFNNNGGGTQLGDYALTFEEGVLDYLLVVTASGVTPYSEGGDDPTPEPDPKNATVTIYVANQVGYEALAMYMYGDKELCGGWPGLAPASTEEISGVTYSIFKVEDAMDRSENIILNNNGAGAQLGDYAIKFEKEVYYFNATETGLVEIEDPHPAGSPSVLYIGQELGWEAVALYAWGDQECFGGWPGKQPNATCTLAGKAYNMFNITAEQSGLGENLILNNNGAGEQADGPKVTLGTNQVFMIGADKAWKAVENPSTRVYVVDNTGWEAIYLYSWGTAEYFGSWPGKAPAGTEKINGVDYKYFDVPAEAFANAGTCNFIFNNNAGTQLENFDCLKGNTVKADFYFTLTADSVK